MEFIISWAGIVFLLMNGSFTFFLLRFAERLIEEPGYDDKVFNKSFLSKNIGNSKKNPSRLDSSIGKHRHTINKQNFPLKKRG